MHACPYERDECLTQGSGKGKTQLYDDYTPERCALCVCLVVYVCIGVAFGPFQSSPSLLLQATGVNYAFKANKMHSEV